jgi:Tol biopolymer transport system component
MRIKRSIILIPILLFILNSISIADSNIQENKAFNNVRKIAFASKRDGNFEIYSINEDGTDLKRLTRDKNDDIKPQWSPSGEKILYLSKKGKELAIRVMNNDGSGQVELARNCATDYPPLWSPDNAKILFVAKIKSKNTICIVDADGSNLARLSEMDTEGTYPSWSPDGLKILCLEKYRRKSYIYMMNPDGTGRLKITKEDGPYKAPTWSPDGSKIAYLSTKMTALGTYNQIMVMNNDSSSNIQLANSSKKYEDIDYNDSFCWSPDGSMIAFTKVADVEGKVSENGSVTFTYFYGTYLVGADGNDYDRLLAKTGEKPMLPDWSPDGSKVAIVSDSKLIIYNLKNRLEDEIEVKVTLPLSPVKWSPDGTKVIFAGKNSSFQKSTLYMVSLDGKVTVLSDENDYDPVWAPNVN